MNLYEFLKNKTRRVKTMDENEVIDNEIEMTPEMKKNLLIMKEEQNNELFKIN